MGGNINVRERYRNPKKSVKLRKPEYIKTPNKPIKILVAHENRLDYHTDKAHRFAEWLDQKKEFEVLYDKKIWSKGEKTSNNETDRREREMVKKTDIIVRLIHPTSKTREKLHEGAKREFRKAMRSGKTVIEIYYMGARTSPNRPIQEINYKNRIKVFLKRGERLEKAIYRGLEIYKKNKEKD